VHILPAEFDCKRAKALNLPEKFQQEPAEIVQSETNPKLYDEHSAKVEVL
jgi:hypothetical protein